MVINPTYLAQRTRQSVNWADAHRRVLKSYREWIRSAPEIQTMYSLNMPVSALRTKMRQEFERHRFVKDVKVVDMLLFQSHAEYQVRYGSLAQYGSDGDTMRRLEQLEPDIEMEDLGDVELLEAITTILKYFRPEEDPTSRLPQNFMHGFLEGRN